MNGIAPEQVSDPCSGLRTFLVPPDIVPVQRRSPLPVRKRTPWRPQPEGAATMRCGGREWFGDKVFCESEEGHERVGYGTSVTVHAVGLVLLSAVLITRPYQVVRVSAGPTLFMPAMAASFPIGAGLGKAAQATEASAPKRAPLPAAPPPAPGPKADSAPAAPVEAPATIEPESGIERGDGGVEGGVVGGVEGGTVGGIVGGVPEGALSDGAPMLGPVRAGGGSGVKPPRRVKFVKPTYPQAALVEQARGVVLVEATIGIDGRVKDTRIIRSIPLLDQAALDAVRQWEYAPTIINGMPVAVIMTILVDFAIQ